MRNALSLDEPGTFETVRRGDVVAWHAETFMLNPEAVVVVGDINTKDVGRALDALFDGLPEDGRLISRDTAADFALRQFAGLDEFVADQARAELQSALDGFEVGRTLRLAQGINGVTDETLAAQLRNGFPKPDRIIIIVVSPNADGLPGACVIRTPQEAVECQ